MQFADNADPDQPAGMRCPLTESLDTIVYVNEQRMSRPDWTDAHADLDLRCKQIV